MKHNTLILHTAALAIMPLQLMFSVFLLFRGHDEPGGGFIGGLVAAGAFVLYAFAFGAEATRNFCECTRRISWQPACCSGWHPPFQLCFLARPC